MTIQVTTREDQIKIMEDEVLPLKRDLERAQDFRDPRVALIYDWIARWPFPYKPSDEERAEIAKLQNKLADTQLEIASTRSRTVKSFQERVKLDQSLGDLRKNESDLMRNINREKENAVERLRHRVDQRIDRLEKYIFPILLGALGSLIFILRSQIAAIREYTYTSHFVSLSLVRISLGTIAGLLGTLVLPTDAIASKDLVPAIASKDVLPLALPLLLGYSVEIFFTFMDRIVKAFTDTSNK